MNEWMILKRIRIQTYKIEMDPDLQNWLKWLNLRNI